MWVSEYHCVQDDTAGSAIPRADAYPFVVLIALIALIVFIAVADAHFHDPAISHAITDANASPHPDAPPPPPPPPTPSPPPTQYDEQIAASPNDPALRVARGQAYLDMEAYAEASAEFDAALALDGGLAEAYLGRGIAAFYRKAWQAAQSDFEQAQTLAPDLADAYAWQGYLWIHRRVYASAVEALQQAVALDPEDPLKQTWLGDALLGNGDAAAAQSAYSAALTHGPSVEAYVGRAMAEAQLGDLEAAQVNLSHAMSTEPFHPLFLNGRAWFLVHYQPERLYEATRLAQQATEQARNDLEKAYCLYTLGWIQAQQGNRQAAIATLEQAARLATVEGEVVYTEITALLAELSPTSTATP